MASLGIQDDTGGVLLFSALEGGVSLLQILYDGQQPSSDTVTWLQRLNVAFCTIYETGSVQRYQTKSM